MATIEENLSVWNDTYLWPSAGDEWSADFGGTEALWYFILYPRIHRFIPAPTILEIAPGFGRWTQFLKSHCQSLIAVDISQRCIDFCKARFASETHITFHVNDGMSLPAIPDDSIDFVFSFDSLVHAERDVIEAYLLQIGRKLTRDGVGFIHSSNIGAYPRRLRYFRYYKKLPDAFRRKIVTKENLSALLSINFKAARAQSMTAAIFCEYCREAGLKCVSQEVISWGSGKCMIDSLSIFARENSRWDSEPARMENTDFAEDAGLISRLAKLYSA